MNSYIDFEVPEELVNKTLDFVKKVADKHGKIKKGLNETTKAIEREQCKLVVIAGDISPPEIVMHLPKIAQEKKIPYTFVNKRVNLGKATGINIPCSSIAVNSVPNDLKDELKVIIKNAEDLQK